MGSGQASSATAVPLIFKTARLRSLRLAEITCLPYNLPTISSHVTGEKPGADTSGDKVGIHRGT
jgi:hypothetical protein